MCPAAHDLCHQPSEFSWIGFSEGSSIDSLTIYPNRTLDRLMRVLTTAGSAMQISEHSGTGGQNRHSLFHQLTCHGITEVPCFAHIKRTSPRELVHFGHPWLEKH